MKGKANKVRKEGLRRELRDKRQQGECERWIDMRQGPEKDRRGLMK